MTYSREIYDKAYHIIEDRRREAESVAQQHTDRVYREIPELEEISRQLVSCSLGAARAVLKGANTKEELERLAQISSNLQKRQQELLASNGYPANYMEPVYTCPHCNDTAYVEKDGKTVYCDCFLKLLIECSCDEINKLSPLSLSTFDTFKLDYYPYDSNADGVSPYTRMSKILNFCRNYAINFNGEGKSILMRGATGLGKTHLSLAIANEVLQKGYYAVYVSAPSLLARLENSHFNYNSSEEEQLLQTLGDCDLLIIDDLGTEFLTPYSKSTIYNIFNNRLLKRKPMIINTNLTVRELQDVYSQRFVSRIIGECDRLDFIGKDIRALKA
ncbi:MAG: ATP-binding protein [Ruminococcus sp.]|nr:ATP-binding protein [Ruminococcus sp.]